MKIDTDYLIKTINEGGIIAYPTEAVYGLGCDPFNEVAVRRLLQIKKRDVRKGLILIAASWSQIHELILPLDLQQQEQLQQSWPGALTWLVPASEKVPQWIKGEHDKVALRVTNHSVAKTICDICNIPLVSTSANISGQDSAKTADEVARIFGDKIDYIIEGDLGHNKRPSTICDLLTQKTIRS